MKENLIAPCGMNCSTCVSYLFYENDLNKQGFHKRYCPGCIDRNKGCTFSLLAANCEKIKTSRIRFCYECSDFPCKGLKTLDNRYKGKYHMSMIENLEEIKSKGMDAFLKQQEEKYKCADCSGVICTHNGLCLTCKMDMFKTKKTYCWDNEDKYIKDKK